MAVEGFWIAFFGAMPALIAAAGALVATIINAWKNRQDHAETTSQITEVHKQINSRMDQMLATTKAASHAEGVKDEKARADKQSGANESCP